RVTNGGLDANWLVRHGIPTITFGAGQRNVHTIEENVELADFVNGCRPAVTLATQPLAAVRDLARAFGGQRWFVSSSPSSRPVAVPWGQAPRRRMTDGRPCRAGQSPSRGDKPHGDGNRAKALSRRRAPTPVGRCRPCRDYSASPRSAGAAP